MENIQTKIQDVDLTGLIDPDSAAGRELEAQQIAAKETAQPFSGETDMAGLAIHSPAIAAGIIQPDMFTDSTIGTICKIALDHYRTYHEEAPDEIMRREIWEKVKDAAAEKQQQLLRTYQQCWRAKPTGHYTVDKVSRWAKERAARLAIGRAITDVKAGTFDLEKLAADLAEARRIGTNKATWIPLADAVQIEPKRWLVKGFLPENDVACIYGASGSCKSFISLDLALSIAAGTSWNGRSTRATPVCYIYSEAPEGFGKRVKAWCSHFRRPLPTRFWMTSAKWDISSDEGYTALSASLAALPEKPGLVVVDTLAKNMAGDENDSEDMKKLVNHLEDLRNDTGATILVVHHTGKDEGRQERGHSSLRGGIDTSLKVTKEGELITLDNQKIKDVATGDSFTFMPKVVDVGTRTDAVMGIETITSLVMERISPEVIKQRADEKAQREALAPLTALAGKSVSYLELGTFTGLRGGSLQRWSDDMTAHGYLDVEHRKGPTGRQQRFYSVSLKGQAAMSL